MQNGRTWEIEREKRFTSTRYRPFCASPSILVDVWKRSSYPSWVMTYPKHYRRTSIELLLALCMAFLLVGCGDDLFEGSYTVTILLPDGGTTEVILPTVCIGVTPPEEAWATVPGPIKPPEPPPETNPDAGDPPRDDPNTPPGDETDPEAGDDESTEEEEVEEPDPCVLAPSTCIGNPSPAWALTDFQPQSCGFGATYGLDVFHERVTFVVLLAAW